MIFNEDLVQKITAEILRRLSIKPSSGDQKEALDSPKANTFPTSPAISEPKIPAELKPLMVVGALDALPQETTKALSEIYSFNIIGTFDNQPHIPGAPLLLTSLGIQPLVRVAYGDEGCTIEGRALLRALLEGRRAVIWDEGVKWRAYRTTAPRSLIAGYLTYEAALKTAGVKIVSYHGLIKALSDNNQNAKAYPPSPPPWSGAGQKSLSYPKIDTSSQGRIITEAAVKTMISAASTPGLFEIGPRDILTPLAKDYLASLRLKIVKTDE
ncbi:MAG: hypothetical protein LBE31_01535 [Deltaproteobacteria bacterium]|nr:hypothetical protein [Deltaproteobacteria bacterium]